MNDKHAKLIEEIKNLAIELMSEWPPSRNKQKTFVLSYVSNGFSNASEACRFAGYSEKSAANTANKMLSGTEKFRHIPPVVEKLQKAYGERSAELSIASGTEVLQHLSKVMERREEEHTVVVIKRREEKWVQMEDGSYKKQTVDIEEPVVVPMPTRVSDTTKAAELLGKYHALWTERHEIDANLHSSSKLDSILNQLTDDGDG